MSEGRGTTRPFELIGAPWVDAEALADTLATLQSAGRALSPGSSSNRRFRNTQSRRAADARFTCSNRDAFRVVDNRGRRARRDARAEPGERFQWRQPPYEYELTKLPFDILAGSSELRKQVESGVPVEAISESWMPALERFRATRKPFLLY